MAAVPMPLPPPWTRKVSPDWRCALSNTFAQTVKNVSGTAAASMVEKPWGILRQEPEGAAQYSA
jgi:hypothetical protein